MNLYLKKTIIRLGLCLTGSVVIVSLLYAISFRPLQMNGFIRSFPQNLLGQRNDMYLNSDLVYISGLTDHYIYLSPHTKVKTLFRTDYRLSDTLIQEIPISPSHKLAWEAVMVEIDSPEVYLSDHISSSFVHSGLFGKEKSFNSVKNISFSNAISISPVSFLLSGYSVALKKKVLHKVTLKDSGINVRAYQLEKQIDGNFCTDGMMKYNRISGICTYVYFYRNEFLVLDADLNLLHKGRTVDTTSRAKIKVGTVAIGKNKEMMLSSPPMTVNKRSYLSTDRLYICSNLMADNEDSHKFKRNLVIDVYGIPDGNYLYSFYIPKPKGAELIDFVVNEKTFFALYGNRQLSAFKLNR